MSKTIPIESRPFCAVRGLLSRGLMCMSVGASSDEQDRKRCHWNQVCKHQQPPATPTQQGGSNEQAGR